MIEDVLPSAAVSLDFSSPVRDIVKRDELRAAKAFSTGSFVEVRALELPGHCSAVVDSENDSEKQMSTNHYW